VADVPVPTLLQVGLLLSEHGDRLATIDFLRRAQARHPGDFGLNDRLARLLQDRRQQSQRVESVACRVAAVAVDPTSGCAWSLLGQSLLAAGDVDRARAVCEHGRDLPPPHVDHILNLGNARFAAGDLDGALAAFELALEADPEFSEAATNQAHALLEAGQAERALQVIEDVLAVQANLETAHQIRARALSALGRRADAEAALRDALVRLPKGARLYQTLGEMLGKRGDEAGVLDVLARGIDACPDAFALHFNRGNHLLEAERYEEALAAFSRAVELRNDDADAWNNRGLALRGLGRMAEAAEALRTAVALDPMYVAAISNLGGTLDDLNDLDAAIDAYLWAVELDPEFDEAWHNLGVTYMKQGRAEESIRAFERSAAIDPESAITIYLIGVVHCDIRRDFDAAIERFREAIAIDPAPAFFYIAQALAHRRKGDPLGAIPVLEEATRRNPKSVRAWSDLGGVCFELERYDESIAAYERILAFAPQHVPSRVMLVRLLADCPDESIRRPDDAVKHSTQVCEAAADQPPAWVFHALALLRAGHAERALGAIQKGADLQGRTGGRMLLLRSLAFAALGRLDEAAAAYDAAEKIFREKTDLPPEVQRHRREAAQALGHDPEGDGDE